MGVSGIAPSEMERSLPTTDTERLGVVDLLRGVALTGILFMNVFGFALAPYSTEAFKANPATLDFWVYAANIILLEGKMRALFGMVFGASVFLFVRNKAITGWRLHALTGRRMGLLVLFGLIHAHLLLWVGDILYIYGICGVLVYLLRNLPPRWLLAAVPLVAVLDVTGYQSYYSDLRAKRLAYVEAVAVQARGGAVSPAQTSALATWHEVERTTMPNRAKGLDITRKMRGRYSDVARWVRPLAWRFETRLLLMAIPDSVALMLLGLALLKLGFLAGTWELGTYRRLAFLGYGLGLPLVVWSFAFNVAVAPTFEAGMAYMERTPVDWISLIYPFQRILLVLGHASLLVLLYRSGRLASLTARFRAVGQMAFTNYIAHTVISTLTFFGYGLGLYGKLAFWQTQVFALAVGAMALVWSPWWLARFRFGPLEWMWRSLTYLRLHPLRRPSLPLDAVAGAADGN
jgi:uncharacterized protein